MTLKVHSMKEYSVSQKVPALELVSTLFTFLPLQPYSDKALKAKHKYQIKKNQQINRKINNQGIYNNNNNKNLLAERNAGQGDLLCQKSGLAFIFFYTYEHVRLVCICKLQNVLLSFCSFLARHASIPVMESYRSLSKICHFAQYSVF